MLNQTFNEKNKTNGYLNDTKNENNLNDEEYQYLILVSFIKNIISLVIFVVLIIVKYLKIYQYFFNEQNSYHILYINCFSGGFLFYISFLFSTNQSLFAINKKDLSFPSNNNINFNKIELISFILGFLLIFFIKKVLLNSVSFYIPLIVQNDISKNEKNNEKDKTNKSPIIQPQANKIKTNILAEISESRQYSFNNIGEKIFNKSSNSLSQKKKKNNIEMTIIGNNEKDESKKEEMKKEHSFNNKNSNNNTKYHNKYLNRPFKDADNDEETNEEFFLSSNEKDGKKSIKKKLFIKNKKLLNGQIPKFNLNPTKVKKNEKAKDENIHKIGTKINKEVFDIVYKSTKETNNDTVVINLFNKKYFRLIIIIFLYNIYFLFIGIFVGFFHFKEKMFMFIILIIVTIIRILYEKNNIMYNNDLFKNEPVIQKSILVVIDLIFPMGIILGNIFIKHYYKSNSIKYFYLIIFFKQNDKKFIILYINNKYFFIFI